MRSTCVTTIHKITLKEFLELCSPNSEEREVYCFLKDSLLFKKEYSKIGVCCLSCMDSKHTLLECPYFFYGRLNEKTLQKINADIDKFIAEFSRKD